MAQITALSPLALPGSVYSFIAKDETSGVALDGTYYWDATLGDDSGTGEIGDPFQTTAVFNSAASIAAGTICKFKCVETFPGGITMPYGGESGNEIRLTTYGSGALPEIAGGVDYNGKDYVICDGLDVDGADTGAYANGGTGVQFKNGTVENCNNWGILFRHVTDGLIDNNIVTDIDGNGTTTGDGINVSNASANCTVSRNQLSGTFARQQMATSGSSGTIWEYNLVAGAGLNALDLEAALNYTVTNQIIRYNDFAPTAGDAVQISGGAGSTSGVLSYHNRMRKALVDSESWDKGLQVANATDVISYGDVIYGFEYNVYVGLSPDVGGELTIYNGTLVESQRNCIRLMGTADLTLRNDIVHVGAGGAGAGMIVIMHETVTLDSDYNLFYSDRDEVSVFYDSSAPWMSFTSWQAAGHDEHSQWADPLFADQDSDDYSLQSGSPAIGSGEDLGDDYKWGLSPTTVFPSSIVRLNRDVYGWDVGAYIVGRAAFTLVDAETYLDGASKAETYLDGGIEVESYLDGAVMAQTEPS